MCSLLLGRYVVGDDSFMDGNERGLLINFMIVSANVANEAISPSLMVMFRDLYSKHNQSGKMVDEFQPVGRVYELLSYI